MTNLPGRPHWVTVCPLLFEIKIFDRSFLLNINLKLDFWNENNKCNLGHCLWLILPFQIFSYYGEFSGFHDRQKNFTK